MSEHNGLGYSGTNAGGNLLSSTRRFRNNRAGIVPNTGSYELCYPQRETTIVGNLVYANNQADTPAIDVALLAMGNGILSAGGVDNVIERNRVYDHDSTGIGLVPFLEEDAHRRHAAGGRDRPRRAPSNATTRSDTAPPALVAVGRHAEQRGRGNVLSGQPRRPTSPSGRPATDVRRSATASPTTSHDVGADRPGGARTVRRRRTGQGAATGRRTRSTWRRG